MKEHIPTFFDNHIRSMKDLNEQFDTIEEIINLLKKVQTNGNTIFTIGNGGSGSTASHFVSDLLKTAITKDEKRFAAISLVDNIPVNLAWSNDQSFESIFVEQLKNFLKSDDLLFVFSGSGNSKNVINAIEYAKQNNAMCVGFTGMDGGKLKNMCDLCITVPSNNMLIIESIHLAICHCLIESIRKSGSPLFKYE